MADIPGVFDQPGAAFVLLPDGVKFPPVERGWQTKPHTYQEAAAHKGNVGIMAGKGFIDFDQDDPAAFEGLQLSTTTTWETRPGRLGMLFRVDSSFQVADILKLIGKKPDLAQLILYKDGKKCGEIKLQRTYQVIPPSWKTLTDGTNCSCRILKVCVTFSDDDRIFSICSGFGKRSYCLPEIAITRSGQ
jgi:hypothetical protein